MSQFSQEQISQFMNDIGFLRKSIQKTTPIIQQIAITKSLRVTSFFSGFAVILLSIISLLLRKQFSSFSDSPLWAKYTFIGLIVLVFITAGIIKSTSILKEARQLQPRISMLKIASQIYTQSCLHLQLSTFILSALAIYHCIASGNTWLWVPIVSCFWGMNFLLYYIFFRITSFMYVGYWHIITAIVISFLPALPSQIGCIITFGIGLIIFAILSFKSEKKPVNVKEQQSGQV